MESEEILPERIEAVLEQGPTVLSRRLLAFVLIPAILGIFLWILSELLREYNLHDIGIELQKIDRNKLGAAVILCFLNYFVLTLYDVLAMRLVGKSLPYKKVSFAAFVSYTFSYNFGFSLISGAAVRYHLYSAWGLSGAEIAQVIAFGSIHFWLGLVVLVGITLTFSPELLMHPLHLSQPSAIIIGIAVLSMILLYIFATFKIRKPLTIGRVPLPLPKWYEATLALIVASLDWILAGAVLFALLPSSPDLTFGHVMAGFFLAQLSGVVSHVPGGLGVFEAMILLSLQSLVPGSAIFGALILFRAIYYLLPFTISGSLFAIYELRRRGYFSARVFVPWDSVEKILSIVVPPALAICSFVGGAILLFSGATPTAHDRLWWIADVMPLPVVEFTHFINSVVGLGLMWLAWGIKKKIDTAYFFAFVLLGTGVVVSILKGLDYEEAAYLGLLFLILIPCRGYFYRKGSLLSGFNATSLIAILAVVASATWLGFFSYKHIEYSSELWWSFTFEGDASRFLRGYVVVNLLMLALGLRVLLGPARHKPQLPSDEEFADARKVIAGIKDTNAQLVLLRDKSLLFSESRAGFVMYRVTGPVWVALGDPVSNNEAEKRELIWNFRDHCDEHDGICVFYEIGSSCLPHYIDVGLTISKLGEEAIVPLDKFTINGAQGRNFRHSLNKMERDGFSFSVREIAEIPALLPALKKVSDDWLERKNTREKCFSLGYFDENYLSLTPVAVVEREGQIVAFANLWHGAENQELSVDLMRNLDEVPNGIMDFLFLNLMLWGKARKFERFNLGMSPLSGLEGHRLGPLWNRAGAFLYQHGEHFYNFDGLRRYKEKFLPEWEPKYIASPGGLVLPFVLTRIASLISRGLAGVVKK